MQTKKLVKILKSNRYNESSTGFTLIELIIASFISVIVIGAAGFGLMAMLRGNKTASIEADRRTEINRALEFISDEVRGAQVIDIDPTTAFNNARDDAAGITYNNFDPTNGEAVAKDNAQPILALRIPGVGIDNDGNGIVERRDIDNNGTIEASEDELVPVLYYIAPPASNVWQGPKIIYRFGPSYDNSGSYSNADDPANWVVEPLIDGIDDDSSNTLTASCDSGFTASIGSDIQGFYACIENNGETAQIFAVGQLENGDTYQADTEVYARAEPVNLSGANSNVSFNPVASSSGTSEIRTFDSEMGCNSDGEKCSMQIVLQQGINSPITMNDGEINSNASINTSQTFTITVDPAPPATNPFAPTYMEDASSTPPNFTLDSSGLQNNRMPITVELDLSTSNPQITILGDIVNNPNYDSNNPPVRLLEDGDLVPTKPDGTTLEPWNPESDSTKYKAIQKVLGYDKPVGDSDKFIENGIITLPKNQYLVVFEVGQTDPNHEGFDLQDQIVLITVQ